MESFYTIRPAAMNDLPAVLQLRAELDYAVKPHCQNQYYFESLYQSDIQLLQNCRLLIAHVQKESSQLITPATTHTPPKIDSKIQSTHAQNEKNNLEQLEPISTLFNVRIDSAWKAQLPENTPPYIINAPLILGAALVQEVQADQQLHLYISKLYVRPAFRRQKIAQNLLNYAASTALHCQAISLDTSPSLTEALKLYSKHGFVVSTPPQCLQLAPNQLYLTRAITH